MKPWAKKSWKAQRIEFLKGKHCEQCGSIEDLIVHHHHLRRAIRMQIQKQIVRALIRLKVDKGEIQTPGIPKKKVTCPQCNEIQVFPENRRTCTCAQCHAHFQFDQSNCVSVEVPSYFLDPKGYKQFLKSFKDEIEFLMKQAGAPEEPEYEDLTQDTVVLCKRCHFALHQGMDLCPLCKKKYKPVYRRSCFDCLPDKQKANVEAYKKMEEEAIAFFGDIDE
jgi:hypothetical protein